MIRSSASLMAEDVTVRCRVRRSATALDPQYDEQQEMTCTMRNWEVRGSSKLGSSFYGGNTKPVQRGRPSTTAQQITQSTMQTVVEDDHHYGPELLLTPVLEFLTNHRDDSPAGRRSVGRRRSSSSGSNSSSNGSGGNSQKKQQQPPPAVQYSIPVADIMVVETYNARYGAPLHRLHITTMSSGVFEFDCHNSNGHDILLAFLQASLSPERILDGSAGDCCSDSNAKISPSMSHSSSCLDLDGFTAKHVQGQVEKETWNEKITRRVGKVVHSLQEMSGSFCDATCCQPSSLAEVTAESRDRAPAPYYGTVQKCHRYPDLELVNEDQDDTETTSYRQNNKANPDKFRSLPSGLSLEPDPEMEPAR